MAEIVTLREKSNTELNEMLENAYEEMFNLRFQKATSGLPDTNIMKKVRRDIAQLKTVLANREQAAAVASEQEEIANALANKDWSSEARFDYEESAWLVTFFDEDGDELAKATVDLNRKQAMTRRDRETKKPRRQVLSYEIA